MDLVSPIMDIVSCLCDCTASRVSYIRELEENLNNLRTSMDELKDTRNDVRNRVELEEGKQMKRTNQVEGWLQRVDAMETQVDEILREGSKEIEERCLRGCCPKNCRSNYKLGKRVARTLIALEKLRSKGGFDVVTETLPPAPVQEMAVVSTTGMDLMFDKAWRFISEERVGILGIYGIGGVGKTTLLKRINNECLHRGGTCDFDVVIWIVVSKEVNLMRMQRDIANRLGLSSSPEDHGSVDDRVAEKLYSVLSKKKFVLLLDDIWDWVDLEAIGVPHPNITNKSKVIFTTRLEAVCVQMEAHKKIRIECLDWPEAWKLFQDKVGEEVLNSNPEITAIARDVAKECTGSPLALITIGRAMATKKTPQEWIYAVNIFKRSASKFSGMTDKVYPRLKFSYDALPDDTIKSCFLYCSLFPEDYSIEVEQLIHYWIGEGFLDVFDDMDEAQNKGSHIVGILKDACLLESNDEEVMMHDVIRDIALWIGCECGEKKDKFLVRAGVNLSEAPEVGKWIEAERVSLMFNEIETLGGEIPTCPCLLTLIIFQNPKLSRISDGFFQYMNVLRLLDLSRTRIKEFPMSIVELVELQYLSLSRTMISKLPQEMKSLVKLKYLILRSLQSSLIIPRETISRFSKLQILDLTKTDYEYDGLDDGCGGTIIEKLECLKDLKCLSITMKNVPSLERFFSFDKCKRYTIELYMLDIKGLTSFPLSTPGILKSLTKLVCYRCSDLEDMAISCMVRNRRNSLPNLHYVYINNCNALKDLSWLRGVPTLERLQIYNCEGLEVICDGCFPNLFIVEIHNCNALRGFSWLHGAPNLKSLKVSSCKVLEIICDDQDAQVKENPTTFSCLKLLELINLPELKSICWLSFPSYIMARVENYPKAPLRMRSP